MPQRNMYSIFQTTNYLCGLELGWGMYTRTRIKHAYQGVQGACPQQAVTSAGVTAQRCERRDVGTGLKLVSLIVLTSLT